MKKLKLAYFRKTLLTYKDGYIESDMKVHCKLDTSHLKANALSGDDEEKATSLFEDRQSAPLAC